MITSRAHARLHSICRLTSRRATAVICGIVVTACATLPGSPHATPVSPEAYQTKLRADGNALKAALDGIEAAPPLAPLASQVDSAASRSALPRSDSPPSCRRHNTPPHKQISFPRSTSSQVNSPESVPRCNLAGSRLGKWQDRNIRDHRDDIYETYSNTVPGSKRQCAGSRRSTRLFPEVARTEAHALMYLDLVSTRWPPWRVSSTQREVTGMLRYVNQSETVRGGAVTRA
jgi:hypothetical protein